MTQTLKGSPQEQAEILMQALPHMLRYDETIVVVKYGGHAMGDEAVARSFAKDMVLLEQSGVNPVVVHGGGPQIGAMLAKLGIKSEFSGGLRITDKATVEIVEMVLAGSINKQIVGFINAAGGRAIGLCGKDGNMVTATKLKRTIVDPDSQIEKHVDQPKYLLMTAALSFLKALRDVEAHTHLKGTTRMLTAPSVVALSQSLT